MKAEAIKDYYILNGKILDTSEEKYFLQLEDNPLYEVIRVIDGVPLFLEDHINRLIESSKLTKVKLDLKYNEIEEDIYRLIDVNKVDNLNIKLLYGHIEDMGKGFFIYCINSFYPPQDYYKNGIHTTIFHHERANPNAKVQISSYKEAVAKKLEESKAFEALLLNSNGYIAEGSRSNIFFVKGDKLYTAPQGNVLLGITRKNIFETAKRLNIKILEELIHIDDLKKLDGDFMTGTSVNILPISTIDDIKLDTVNNKLVEKLRNAFEQDIKDYINR